MKKILLAYSGGLDTSYCLKKLVEKYDVYTITIDTGGFLESEKQKKENITQHFLLNVIIKY